MNIPFPVWLFIFSKYSYLRVHVHDVVDDPAVDEVKGLIGSDVVRHEFGPEIVYLPDEFPVGFPVLLEFRVADVLHVFFFIVEW